MFLNALKLFLKNDELPATRADTSKCGHPRWRAICRGVGVGSGVGEHVLSLPSAPTSTQLPPTPAYTEAQAYSPCTPQAIPLYQVSHLYHACIQGSH